MSISGDVSVGEAVVHAAAAHKCVEDFHVLEFIRGPGEHIAVDDNKISKFSGFEGSFAVLFEAGVGPVMCIQRERLFDRDAFLRG